MITINTTNINEARKQIEKIKKEQEKSERKDKIAILSQDDEFNRKALEIKGINLLVINEDLDIKDYSKQRNSSLNEVLANICAKKNIEIGIQIDKIIKKDSREKAKSLSRLIQNIALIKKEDGKIKFLLENLEVNKKNLQSLLITLGADTKQALEAIK
jgi:RNase P/RNase MRP subunit p30